MEQIKEPGESPVLWTLAGLLIVVLVGLFDWAAGPGFSFTLIYLAPLFLVAGRADRVGGALVAGASAVAYYWGQTPENPPVSMMVAHVWNTFSTLVIFMVVYELLYAYQHARREQDERDWIDPVTGTGNAKYLLAVVGHELSRAKRFKRPLTIAYLDVTHLREVNEKMGHAGGNTLLSLVANTIKRHTRNADVVTRLGGDEFVILLPEADDRDARMVMERITSILREVMEHDGWPASVAVGVATFTDVPASADEAIAQAERAMYAAKDAGAGEIEFVICPAAAVAS